MSGKFPYVVILKTTKDRPLNILANLLNIGSAAFFVNGFLFGTPVQYPPLVAVAVMLGILVWNYRKLRKGQKAFYDRAYLITGLLWMGMPYMQWLFLPFILLALLEHQVKFPLEIGFSESQIVLNTIFKKRYSWSQLTNVMLRDGLLTMDFANNYLLQREVEDDEDEDDASEEEFNQFCRQQLKKNPV
jgi:hypothetical protein